jgi:HlyD family secretion protein
LHNDHIDEVAMQPIPIRRSITRVAAPVPPARGEARWRKTSVWLPAASVVCIALAIGGIEGLRHRAVTTRAPVRTELVTRGQVIGVLKVEGRLQTQTTVRVGSTSWGQVTAVEVDVGDRVRRGQVLARLEDLEQRAAAADATASARAAQIRRVRAEKHLTEELGKLDDPGSSAGDLGPDDLLGGPAGEAQLDLMSAYVQVDRASSQRALARGVLARRVIRAPTDGIVLSRAVDPGETIMSSPPGPPLFVIGSEPARLRLEIELDDGDAARVHPSSATLIVPAYPRRTFVADIRQVLPASALPMSDNRYRVVLDVANAEGVLRPGMSATVAIPVESAPNVLRVPVAALVPAAPHAGARDAVVWVLDEHGARAAVPVETGITNAQSAEIRAGSLRPGASVVIAGTP